MPKDNTLEFNATLSPETEEDTYTMTTQNELRGADESGSRSTEAQTTSAYGRVLAKLKNMPFEQMNEVGNSLFGDNHYQRIFFYSWLRTLQNCRNPKINPRYYTPNLIGDPGYGKSGLVYEAGLIIQGWLTELAGEPMEFRVVVRTLAGINDFADIMGIVAVDRDEFLTRLAPPMAFPKEGDNTFGCLFIDDFNRGHQHVIAGAMEFVNTGKYNDYRLPVGYSMVAAMNPQGKNNKVTSIDRAQSTRFINLPYSPSRKQFINQLVEQGVDTSMLAYFMKFEEVGMAPSAAGVLPEPRETNWRNLTILAHMYPALAGDPMALNIVADAILGPNQIRDLHRILQGEMPLGPEEILGGNEHQRKANPKLAKPADAWEKAEAKLKEFEKSRRTDLITVTTHRLVVHLNNAETHISDEQINVLGEFFMMLPKEAALDGLRRLIQPGCPRADHYRPKLTMWKSPDGKKGGPLTDKFLNLVMEVRSKVKELRAKEESGQGGVRKV